MCLLLAASAAQAGVGVDVNVHLGDQPRAVVVQPPPPPAPVYVAPAPVAAPAPEVVFNDDVDFIYPNSLGFYVAVGVPYDLFYVGTRYYLFRDGRWLCAPSSHGPWVVQRYRELPPGLRRHRIERIREFRAREYDVYRRDHDHYRGRYFRTSKEEWKAQRRAEKEERKWDKHREKEDRKWEKERRKEEKHAEKWERHEGRDRDRY